MNKEQINTERARLTRALDYALELQFNTEKIIDQIGKDLDNLNNEAVITGEPLNKIPLNGFGHSGEAGKDWV